MTTYKLCTISRTLCLRTIRSQVLYRCYAQEIGAAPAKRMSNMKLILISMGVGGLIGTGYSGYSSISSSDSVGLTRQTKPAVIDKLPDDLKVTRKIYNPNDNTDLNLVLFQYQTCPFCCKVSYYQTKRFPYQPCHEKNIVSLIQVRAFLDSQGFSYSIVEVDAVLRQAIKWSKYKKVPMLLAKRKDGKYVQLTDSSMIISALASFLVNPNQDIGQLVDYYPNVSFVDDNGSQKTDVINKYFLMFQEERPPKSTTRETME